MAKPGPDQKVEDSEFILAILRNRKPVRSTSEIGDSVGLSRPATKKHLTRLYEEGYLHKDKAGPTTVWWPTPEGKELLD